MINKIKAEIENIKVDYTTSRKRELQNKLNKCLNWAEESVKELKEYLIDKREETLAVSLYNNIIWKIDEIFGDKSNDSPQTTAGNVDSVETGRPASEETSGDTQNKTGRGK